MQVSTLRGTQIYAPTQACVGAVRVIAARGGQDPAPAAQQGYSIWPQHKPAKSERPVSALTCALLAWRLTCQLTQGVKPPPALLHEDSDIFLA